VILEEPLIELSCNIKIVVEIMTPTYFIFGDIEHFRE
jgi:hypothetical protein